MTPHTKRRISKHLETILLSVAGTLASVLVLRLLYPDQRPAPRPFGT